MNCKLIGITLVIFSVVGCHQTQKYDYSDSIKLNVFTESKPEVSFSDYFELQKVVYLESDIESNIGELDKIMFRCDTLYIVDNMTNSVLLFDINGNYLSKIKKSGKGPGEYLKLADLDYDESKHTVLILDSHTQKVIEYDNNAHFKSEYRIDFPANEFKLLEGSRALYSYNSPSNKVESSSSSTFCDFIIESDDGKLLAKACETPNELAGFYYHVRYDNSIINSNGKSYVIESLGNIIYSIDSSYIESKYFVEFDKYNIPEKVKASKKRVTEEINNYCHSIRNFYEDSTIIYFQYNKRFGFGSSIFYKKDYYDIQCDSYNDNDNLIPLNLVNTRGNHKYLISVLEPERIIEYYDDKLKNGEKCSNLLMKLVSNISINDNPVFLIYERKCI